ncbi:MAG TPA: tetratricopeptide repeat protein, partial [Thermoanaerobaculia bacterium]|nr:tetratricopeptide repeat protein [Thermoanaerobaculia bacterium]
QQRRLARTLAGDLDTIVMTALRRDPERRYASVAALADDLQRFLDGRPIRARRDSPGYRAARFVRRHRLAVAAAALALLSLVTGLVVALRQTRRAEQAAAAARAAAAAARSEETKAQAIATFLTDVFTAADPEGKKAADLTAAELVQRGAARIDTQLAQQPASRAAMLHVLGLVQYRLGLFPPAREMLEKALALRRALRPPVPRDVAATAAALGVLAHRQGREQEAFALLEEARAYHEQAGAAAAVELAKDLNNLANTYKALHRDDEARAAFERAIAVLDHSRDPEAVAQLPRVLNNYGLFLDRRGETPRARTILERALALHERNSGPNSALVAGTLSNLVELYVRVHEVELAVATARRALAIADLTYGPAHPETGNSANVLGWALLAAQRPAEARPLFERAVAIARGALGEKHYALAYPYRNLGTALADTGHPIEAIAAYRHAVSIWTAALGEDAPELTSAYIGLGPVLIDQGAADEGEGLLRRAVAMRQKAKAPNLGEAWVALARGLRARCRLHDAGDALAAAQEQARAYPTTNWARRAAELARETPPVRCGTRGSS